MPLYTFKCPVHGEVDKIMPMADRDKPCLCGCGRPLTRLMSASAIRVVKRYSDTVRDTLNREHRGNPSRQTMLMAGGLEEPKPPVIGIGIGG